MKVRYISILNSFHRFRKSHRLSDKAVVLYVDMLDSFNAAFWPAVLICSTAQLMELAQTNKKDAAYRARDELVNAGLLRYQPGKRGSPSVYELCGFCPDLGTERENTCPGKGSVSGTETQGKCPGKRYQSGTETQGIPIYQDKTEKFKRKTTEDDAFSRFWKAYPRNDGKKQERWRDFVELVKKGIDPEDIVHAAEIYRDDTRKTEARFVKSARTFLRDPDFITDLAERWHRANDPDDGNPFAEYE